MLPENWISIDPGDKYVGIARWEKDVLMYCYQLDPTSLVDLLSVGLTSGYKHVVCESFELYPWMAASLSGNQFLTPQLIGVIKYLCGVHNVSLTLQRASEGKRIYKMEPYVHWRAKEWKIFTGLDRVPSTHVKDAIVHGLYYQHTHGGIK